MFKIETTPENAAKFKEWIATRGGVAKWKSVNLSNPGASWSTPATIKRGDLENPHPHLLSRQMWDQIYKTTESAAYDSAKDGLSVTLEQYLDQKYQEHVTENTEDLEEVIPYPNPNWQCGNDPEIITDPKEIGVATYKTVKTIRIALRRAGFSIKLTDASSRRLRAACSKFEDSTYVFGGDDGRDCYIQVPERIVALDEVTS